MEWQLKVPKICHFYWGGDTLPYMRYLSVYSFLQQNPDWDVRLWMPVSLFSAQTWATKELKYAVECESYLDKLRKLPIKITPVDFREFRFTNDMAENYKSDFMHYHLLATYGGVCSDMDIIYFSPIEKLAVNVPENKDVDAFVCISGYGHSNGFFMASANSLFFGALAEKAKRSFNPHYYQSLGPDLVNKYYPTLEHIKKICSVINIGMEAVYAHDAFHVKELIGNLPARFTDNSIGVHWYAGHPIWEKFIKDTNGGLTNLPDSIIGSILKLYE